MRCYKCLEGLEGETIHGLHKNCFFEWFKEEEEANIFALTPKTVGNSNDPLTEWNSSFFHGKFKKYAARLGKRSYLIKVRHDPYIELPAMEFLCNQIAKLLKVEVPDFYFIKLHGTVDAFVARNFMDHYPDSNLIHLYRLMNGRPFDLENIIRVIFELTESNLEVDRFVYVCLFDALIGNHDRHGRNLAIIQSPKGKFLSPFYDNPTCLAIEEEALLKAWHEPCGKIYTSQSTEPKMSEYVQELCRLNHDDVIQRFERQINLEQISDLIHISFISDNRKEAFFNLIKRRVQELKIGLERHGKI